jgi:uncharacterized membrane protein YwzB
MQSFKNRKYGGKGLSNASKLLCIFSLSCLLGYDLSSFPLAIIQRQETEAGGL